MRVDLDRFYRPVMVGFEEEDRVNHSRNFQSGIFIEQGFIISRDARYSLADGERRGGDFGHE